MSPPLPTATAMEIARYVLPDADDATVSSAASTIGLFAANCVWQAMMQIAEEHAAKVTAERARALTELRRLAALADEVTDPQAAMLYEDFARWMEAYHG